ncbi:DUF3619 family protein [Acidovorax sp. Leaf160]|uniref:DUF3619 family protein n=1 Tax=Acidovorax sp. Leaf160 TaxID=1736280 RepID=UPI0006FF8680|nr:DUF3619 family protein [Acidovorax sp. Leaf160]KQR55312.1 hypothetical protein ASF94_02310 [Acidovorax sp. Leaf160]
MNRTPSASAELAADRFARRVTARLNEGTDGLPYDITERLRAARVQALDKRRKPAVVPVRQTVAAPVMVSSGGSATLGWGGEGGNWWRALISAAPLTALVVGLVFINIAQDEHIAHEIAEVDTALLTDDLPPSAYTDPGFLQFLKTADNSR